MGGTIFISYRRDEGAWFAGRLFDRLERTFGREALFMDVDSIAPGQDFVLILEAQVAKCNVLLALIGRGWLTATDEAGRRRLDKAEDFVRIEIATALTQGKNVIPVLIDDVPMPRSEDLPEELKPLVHRQATRLSHDRFRADSARLIQALKAASIPTYHARWRRWLKLITAVALAILAGSIPHEQLPDPITIRVPARPLDWSRSIFTSSNIHVKANQRVIFNACGQWYINAGLEGTGPEGKEDWCECVVSKKEGEGRRGRLGALIGKIGEGGEPFLVGAQKKIITEKSGIIFLGINDNMAPCYDLGTNRGSCYKDNHGDLEVKIQIQ